MWREFSIQQFKVSPSNSIYGHFDKVQPTSYTVYYIMRVK